MSIGLKEAERLAGRKLKKRKKPKGYEEGLKKAEELAGRKLAEREKKPKKKKKTKKKERKDRYEERDESEERAFVEPVEPVEVVSGRPRKPIVPKKPKAPPSYYPFFGGGIEDEGLRQYRVTRERYGPTRGAEYPPGIVDIWLVEEERFFEKMTGDIRGKAKIELGKAEEAKLTGRDIEAGLRFSGYGARRAGAGIIEGLTFPIRPLAWGKTARSIYQLFTKKEARKRAIEVAKRDPMGVLAEGLGGVAGGGLAGRGISSLSRKFGIVKPKTYRLKETTVPRPKLGETPASLMPKGKWRSTWEIARKGGTPALILKERPEFMKIYEPAPVYGPSLLEPGLGLLGGLRTLDRVKPEAPARLEPGPQIPAGYLDVIQRMEPIKGKLRGELEQEIILKPVSWRKQEPKPMVLPEYKPKQKKKKKQRRKQGIIPAPAQIPMQKLDIIPVPTQIPKQKQRQRQKIGLAPFQLLVLRTPSQKKEVFRLPFEEKKRKRRRKSLVFGFEQKIYGVQTAKELKRLLG